MNKILGILDATGVEFGKFRVIVAKTIKDLTDKQAELDAIKDAQSVKEENLKARELVISKIENVVALKESAQALIKQSETEAQKLLEAQRAFELDVARRNKEVADKQKENEKVWISNKNESDALVKLRKELEEERKNYKQRLAQGIINQADKVS